MGIFEELIQLIPEHQLKESGAVFYSGKSAFDKRADLYILGLNPGGCPTQLRESTIQRQVEKVRRELPEEWSAYSDESWQGAEAGTWGLQPRILHAINKQELHPRSIPSSNLVFIRTARQAQLKSSFSSYAEETWPFHQHLIDAHKTKAILCFGIKTGNWVARKLNATEVVDTFTEANNRRWTSKLMQNNNGLHVIIATHPSIADWTSCATDPSRLISRALGSPPLEALQNKI
jgi:hypothetical protein